ncbi:MAG: phytanoyl-CoA dioxygenase family protein [Pseudomonas sp.]|uniref:phytanoyl-CoA dioxygenase family protein n=1 Tax=Pseudomonas sp. TaxID=306 RepID=UPI00339A2D55
MLTELQWSDFDRDGFVHLGKLLDADTIAELTQRADDLASGAQINPQVQLQLDTGGDYDALPEAVSSFQSGTRLYRKIQGLENDPLYSPLVRHPLFLNICARLYGAHAPVSLFRAMIMNKPAGQGTYLPWHQDAGDVWALDRDPLVTIWLALDPAMRANGCVEIIPGSHRLGLLSAHGSTLGAEDVQRHCPPERALPLEVEAGHAVLMHNWLIHRSGVNPSNQPRRAFTACYMDGRTRSVLTGHHFPLLAGTLSQTPDHYVQHLQTELAAVRHSQATAQEYAHALEQEVAKLHAALEHRPAEADWAAVRHSQATAQEYAHALEQEVAKLRLALETRPEQAEWAAVRHSQATAQEYAHALEQEVAKLRLALETRPEQAEWAAVRHSQATAQEYAHALEQEVAKLRLALEARADALDTADTRAG